MCCSSLQTQILATRNWQNYISQNLHTNSWQFKKEAVLQCVIIITWNLVPELMLSNNLNSLSSIMETLIFLHLCLNLYLTIRSALGDLSCIGVDYFPSFTEAVLGWRGYFTLGVISQECTLKETANAAKQKNNNSWNSTIKRQTISIERFLSNKGLY